MTAWFASDILVRPKEQTISDYLSLSKSICFSHFSESAMRPSCFINDCMVRPRDFSSAKRTKHICPTKMSTFLVDTGTQRTKPARQKRWGEQRFDNEEIREYTMRHNCLCCLSLAASGSSVHVSCKFFRGECRKLETKSGILLSSININNRTTEVPTKGYGVASNQDISSVGQMSCVL